MTLQASLAGSEMIEDRSVALDTSGQDEDSPLLVERSGSVTELIILRWSLNPLPNDPALIQTATLVLSVSAMNTPYTFNLQMRALSQARPYFPETTWSKYDGILDWPAGTLGSTAAAETIMSVAQVRSGQTEVRLNATQLVKDWISGNRVNHGVVLTPSSSGLPVDIAFHSSESVQESLRPRLEVTYQEGGVGQGEVEPLACSVSFVNPQDVTANEFEEVEINADVVLKDNVRGIATTGQYRISLDNTNWTVLDPRTERATIHLGPEDGTKRIYVEYMDDKGNVSLRPATASIILDRKAPSASIKTPQSQ